MSTPTPLDPVRQLCERLKEEADKIGLHLYQVAIMPHSPEVEAPDLMQCVFVVRPEAVADPADPDKTVTLGDKVIDIDTEMAGLEEMFKQQDVKEKFQERTDEAKSQIADWLNERDK